MVGVRARRIPTGRTRDSLVLTEQYLFHLLTPCRFFYHDKAFALVCDCLPLPHPAGLASIAALHRNSLCGRNTSPPPKTSPRFSITTTMRAGMDRVPRTWQGREGMGRLAGVGEDVGQAGHDSRKEDHKGEA